MGAALTKTVADLRRRRLQTAVIAVVLSLATGTATLALSILVESHAPFEHAFSTANGAHLVLHFRADVDPAELAATGSAARVTTSAGPWPVVAGSLRGPGAGFVIGGSFSGRPQPDASIDAVTISEGRWWQAPGEVVLDGVVARFLRRSVGEVLTVSGPEDSARIRTDSSVAAAPRTRDLTIVGIARSVSTPEVAAWMSPSDVDSLASSGSMAQEMLYRVDPSASTADLAGATASIVAVLPAGALSEARTYLDVMAGVDRLADLYVPVLLAFSVFALLAAAFLIANVVTGVVLTNYRDIGVMKAIGYTPSQVRSILLGEVLVPAAIGAVLGVIVGTLASEPVVHDTAASFGLPTAYTLSSPVVIAVLAMALATCVVAALAPATRAGRISAVSAMTRGTAPSSRSGGGRLMRLGIGLPIGLSGRLGISAGLANPVRASMTLGALTVGVAAATFSLGLDASLLRVKTDLDRDVASPVRALVTRPFGGPGAGTPTGVDTADLSPAEVTSVIRTVSEIGQSVAIGQADVVATGLGAVPLVGYDGGSSWVGYALIEGSWFARPGEVVAPTVVFTRAGLHIGDSITISRGDRTISVRLVGETFEVGEQNGGDLVLRGTWADLATLDPTAEPDRWEMRPAAGVDPGILRDSVREATAGQVQVYVVGDSGSDASFLLFLTVVGVLGAVLVAMSIGGVFNTVLLETRQRTHDVAVLKAIGLTPWQVIEMVVATTVPVGIVAGLVGVPIGLAAQRLVLDYMGEVAAGTAIPSAIYDVFPMVVLLGLALLGVVIGAAGAYLPAQRAALARIAPVLQGE